MNESYDHLFKFLIIGAAGTGKSCMLHQFLEGRFKNNASHTIGVEFGSKVVTVAGKSVKLQIWDTAGQERFRSVTRSYYRGAAAAILVYDIANRESFNSLANWLQDARTLASPNIVVVLAGNKRDLESQGREIPFLEASTFAQENELLFLECSALSGENIENVFLQCTRTVLGRLDQQQGILSGENGRGFGLRNGSQTPIARNLRTPANEQENESGASVRSTSCQC